MAQHRPWWKVFAAVCFWTITAVPCLLTLAGFGASWHWRLELACHFRVQYLAALLALSGVLVLARRFRALAVPGAFAAINLVLIAPLYFGGVRTTELGELRALSVNVTAENRNYGKVLQLVGRTKPDFLLLIDIDYRWAQAMQSLTSVYPHSRVMASPGSSGIALYSRHPMEELEIRVLDTFGRPVIFGRTKIGGRKLALIGIHPSSPRTRSSTAERNQQLAAIGKLAQEQIGPLILFGDMNTTSWSPCFCNLVETTGLVDSRRGFGVEPSWPVDFPAALIPIDHFLVSPDIVVHDRWVGPDIGSDHYPVVLDFSLPRPIP